MYDSGTQGLNRYSYALNNPFRYNDPTGNAVNAAYNNETPYSVFPYASTIDTGSTLADYALGTLGGVWNLAATALNILPNAGGVFEGSYNAATKQMLGQEGFSGGGLAVDSFMWAQMGVPVGAVSQSLQCARTYLRAAAPLSKLKIALASERGAIYWGWSKTLTEHGREGSKIDIALGLDGRLERFAAKINAKSYHDWESSGLIKWGERSFGEAFVEAANKARGIHFNLDDFSVARALQEGGQGGAEAFKRLGMNWTSAEFMTIKNTPSLWEKTTFYKGNTVYPKELLIKDMEVLIGQ